MRLLKVPVIYRLFFNEDFSYILTLLRRNNEFGERSLNILYAILLCQKVGMQGLY